MLDLTYHEMCADDHADLTALASDWRVVRQLGGWAWPMDPDQVAKYCKPFEGDGFCWTIKHSGEWAGRIGVTGANIGYTLPRSVHGRGIATQATRHATAHFFDTNDADVLTATTWIDNPASHRVLIKCGFTHWQTCYRHALARGYPVASRQYRLTRTDWQRLRACAK
ncbi:GNAT family N-acetyltransferase [Loktanella sp. F6476L]|uniref:GNAT family N-acetyltransferase n=1 Tax=Loktanella sp. F6476L TaxID=2926405 RepID=UPI001FF1D70C|nr:GNAT family N-acetyltransferase [Loktanella sp. F6476L]MCK0121436.1 GNAT family N-acetyltransferase [Loktanella sp. F6476L]